MSSKQNKPSAAPTGRPSRIESASEEARLDALVARRPAPVDKKGTVSKLPSKLDRKSQASRVGSRAEKPPLPSRLDRSQAGPSSGHPSGRLPPLLDTTSEAGLSSKVDPSRFLDPSRSNSKHTQGLPSRLDSTRMQGLALQLDPTRTQKRSSKLDTISIKTASTSVHDIKMASRQTQYDSLPPNEQKVQEEWAQTKIAKHGPCPEGYRWNRVPGGYNCSGLQHWMTDKLLAEGRGGFYMRALDWNLVDTNRRIAEANSDSSYTNRTNGKKDIVDQMREIGFSKGFNDFAGPYYSIMEAQKDGWHQGPGNPSPNPNPTPLLYQWPYNNTPSVSGYRASNASKGNDCSPQ